MRFAMARTTDMSNCPPAPCDGCESVTVQQMDFLERVMVPRNYWVRDFDSLESLAAFLDEAKEPIIIEKTYGKELAKIAPLTIEIYDGYRE